MDESRTHYHVEVFRTDGEYESFVSMAAEFDSLDELEDVVKSLEDEGKLDWPYQIRINKMTDLSAPLTDEEESELQAWIDNMD